MRRRLLGCYLFRKYVWYWTTNKDKQVNFAFPWPCMVSIFYGSAYCTKPVLCNKLLLHKTGFVKWGLAFFITLDLRDHLPQYSDDIETKKVKGMSTSGRFNQISLMLISSNAQQSIGISAYSDWFVAFVKGKGQFFCAKTCVDRQPDIKAYWQSKLTSLEATILKIVSNCIHFEPSFFHFYSFSSIFIQFVSNS